MIVSPRAANQLRGMEPDDVAAILDGLPNLVAPLTSDRSVNLPDGPLSRMKVIRRRYRKPGFWPLIRRIFY